MPRRRPLATSAAVVVSIALAGGLAACEARSYGSPARDQNNSQVAIVVPASNTNQPVVAPGTALGTFDGVQARVTEATENATDAGADIVATVLDRDTGQILSNGNASPMPIASVAKLFIADDVLLQESNGQLQLSPADHQELDVMLQSSDDNAANDFWNRGGGTAIIDRVTARYGLGATTKPYDGNWWNTMSTTADLVHYYSLLLNGGGGLPTDQANIILSDLAKSTPTGVDGYPQRFGIPDGLSAEPVAVKQGWMCCWNGDNWMHMSTGVIGSDRRYVMAIGSLQPSDDATARTTITQAVKTMFPAGRI